FTRREHRTARRGHQPRLLRARGAGRRALAAREGSRALLDAGRTRPIIVRRGTHSYDCRTMAKCDEGYICEVCGKDVPSIVQSDLYLRCVVGLIDPEALHTTSGRHIRCNPALAQFIVDDRFEPVTVEGDFDKRRLDSRFVLE